ncbi:hypothetical protein GCM10009634_68230 [Saccharothrix xinjiangensis]
MRALLVDRDALAGAASASVEDCVTRLRELHQAHRADYRAYYERHATPDSPPMRDADPAIVLVPGVGMFSWWRSATRGGHGATS